MIGGKGEQKTLEDRGEARRHLAFVRLAPDALPHKLDVLARWGDEVGRDVSQITVSNELTRHRVDLEYADALYDAGVRLFTLGIRGPDYDLSPVSEWLAWRDAKNG